MHWIIVVDKLESEVHVYSVNDDKLDTDRESWHVKSVEHHGNITSKLTSTATYESQT